MVLESFFGDTLVKNDGSEVKTSELSTEKGGVIGIYFSAHWCPPCRGFTPKLATIYNEIKEAEKDFEIVFVSWDRDEDSFKNYHKEQPWLAVPYSNAEGKTTLNEKYEVNGIPTLILLEADTGNTISRESPNVIMRYGASGFPFTSERLAEAKKNLQRKKEEALQGLANFNFLGKLATMDEPDKEVDLHEVTRKSEALAFAFMDGENCRKSAMVLPKLLDAQRKLGREKLSVIIVPMMKDDDNFSTESLTKMKGVPMIPRGEKAQEVANQFKPILQNIEAPHVFVIDARDESSMKILADDAARNIYFHGENAFPWSEQAIKGLEERERALKEEMKAKQKNLELFSPSDSCRILDKQGAEVTLKFLQSKDVVGVYFSAHWCGPCRSFTPKLVEVYNECKEQGKSFEVIFISSDRTQEAFDEYYAEMPWCTLKFEDRTMKAALSDVFDAHGIPTLILLKGDGEMITDEGREAVLMGSEYFPWSPEGMERGRAEEGEREARKLAKDKEKEERSYIEQEEAGKIVLRRYRGTPSDTKIGSDHVVKFVAFATVAAPSAVVPNGKKAWYEITFVKGSGVSQVGWATSDFETTDSYSSDGVGDDTKSWGFDGQRVCKWFDGQTNWGKAFEPSEGHVLGLAADMENGRILFGLDGDWGEPMGVAFENLDPDLGVFPAMSCTGLNVSVNFGDRDMKFGPPDDSFEKLIDVVNK